MEWKPIETAPKDGQLILACLSNPSQMHGYFCAFWSDDFRSWMFASDKICQNVKYWMPLPAPPTEKSA